MHGGTTFVSCNPKAKSLFGPHSRMLFRNAHIPIGLMGTKKKQFYALKKGTQTVIEYLHKFNHHARYTPTNVSNEAAKMEHFMDGLTDEMQLELAALDFHYF